MAGSIDPRCETLRGIHWPVKVAGLFGTRVAETILASGPPNRINRPDIWMQAIRSDHQKLLRHGGRPHMGPGSRPGRRQAVAKSRRLTTSGRRLRAVPITRPVAVVRVGRRPIGVGVTEVFGHRRRRAVYLPVLVMFRSRGDLHGRGNEQRRTENCEDCLSHFIDLLVGRSVAKQKRFALPARCSPHNDASRGLLRRRQSRSGEQISCSNNFCG